MALTNWLLDTTHSEILFKIRHMMISNVTGQFRRITGTVEMEEEDLTTARVQFEADVASVDTNNEQRDNHLLNPDFFDATAHPKLTFVSTRMEKVDEEHYLLHGALTLRGVSQPLTLSVDFGGIVAADPWGHTRAGFTLAGKLNRKDFGIEFGGPMLGEQIALTGEVQLVKQVVAVGVARGE